MTKNIDTSTDVNIDLKIADESPMIAKNIMEGFIIPVLNRKTQVSGLQESVQLYIDLSYLMLAERVRMIGRDGIDEMRELVNELEDAFYPQQVEEIAKPIIHVNEFMELSRRVS